MTRKQFWIGISILLFITLVIIFIKRKSVVKYVQAAIDYTKGKVWDYMTAVRINNLHPSIRQQATEFINKAEAEGIKLRITSGLRTFAEQDKLYAQGRTEPGAIVTYAKAGESTHNYGLSFDVVPIVNGKADYNTDWDRIALIGKSFGFQWGGDWSGFEDKPHFEKTFGLSIAQLQNLYNSGQLQDDYIVIS